MSNISGLLHIGRTALMTQQKAIDITGSNIANVNTPGYSRQRLIITQSAPVRDQNATLSTGVSANLKIQRFYDQFITSQLSNENETLGRWEARRAALEKVEMLFDEGSGYGLSYAMSEYWSAWHAVANNPSGHVERTVLLSAGRFLATSFNQLSSNMDSVQRDIDTSVSQTILEINRTTAQIAELNAKIAQIEVTGHNANDYRDQRDLLAFDLSKLIDIDSFEDADGFLTIMAGGGKPLVERTFTWNLSAAGNADAISIRWEDSSGTAYDITSRIQGGELKGWIEARDTIINGYKTRLDALAGSIISEVNALHAAGFNLYGSQNNFFEGTDAASMRVHGAIEADINFIAAAGNEAGLPGNNGTALAIADLQNGLLMSASSTTFDHFYTALVGDIGSDVRSADLNYTHQYSMIHYLQNYREEVSGVSIDEEMVNLIKFQHAYNAAARLITTVDEMMQTLIGMLR
jgi:flagellar hook-associated protein 1